MTTILNFGSVLVVIAVTLDSGAHCQERSFRSNGPSVPIVPDVANDPSGSSGSSGPSVPIVPDVPNNPSGSSSSTGSSGSISSSSSSGSDGQNVPNNSRTTRLVERHAENIRLYLCRKGDPITPEQWDRVKSECINSRLEELMPENAIAVWQQCSQRVSDLCDEQQWMEGKRCASDLFEDQDISEIQGWYKGRMRQMGSTFQVIKRCYQTQKTA